MYSGITTTQTRTCPQTASKWLLRMSADATMSIGYTHSGITMRLGAEKHALCSAKTHSIDDIINMANSDKNSVFCETKKNLEKNQKKDLTFLEMVI